jgi:Protein of unknown function (DUF2924)
VKASDPLKAKLAALASASRAELVDEFERVYGRAPPKRLSDSILALAVAYRLQEQVMGGLRPETKRFLLADNPAFLPTRASAGTILIREWQGREYTVTVHPDGVEFAGQRFRSLTDVAFRITGQKRSGPAFFGLRKLAP